MLPFQKDDAPDSMIKFPAFKNVGSALQNNLDTATVQLKMKKELRLRR